MKQYPTPIAGLALGIAGIALFWSVLCPAYFNIIFILGCGLSFILISPLIAKFIFHPTILWNELQHSTLGSAIPTLTMTTMLISYLLSKYFLLAAEIIWLAVIGLHLIFFLLFTYHQVKKFSVKNIIPGWYVPPIGITECTFIKSLTSHRFLEKL